MATDIQLAFMAGRAYYDTRKDINRFPVPDGWTEFFHVPNNPDYPMFSGVAGFEAVSFQKGNEIVISYAGTYDKDYTGDIMADIGLATGNGSAQLLQAAEYYLQVKAANDANPNVHITLTGHSLGGGLAALVGVFFGVQVSTFDQAPFARSAATPYLLPPNVAASLRNDLAAQLDSKGKRLYNDNALAGLTNYLQLQAANGGIPNAQLVSTIRVDGEFLSAVPPSIFSPIGSPATILHHGPYSNPSLDMHSIALLTAFLESDATAATVAGIKQSLNEVTTKLTSLLGMFFDSSLYAFDTDPTNTKDSNFLENLIRHQEGLDPAVPNDGDQMLTRFTSDLWKIAQDGGLTMSNIVADTLIGGEDNNWHWRLAA